MDKKAMYQMMGSRPMYAGQTNIVNPNDPRIPVQFQTGSYITPQPPSMVPPDPNSVTGLEMQTMPMQKKSCGMKKYGARQNDPSSTLKKIGEKVGELAMSASPSLLAGAHAANLALKAKEHFFSSKKQAVDSAKDWAKSKANNVTGN